MPETNRYLKPMLDPGSPRVFNCNVLTRQILAKDPNAIPFFRTKPMNHALLIKDTAPDHSDRKSRFSVGTKLYFPFNVENIYEGGRTIFIHDRGLEAAVVVLFGEGAVQKDIFAQDVKNLEVLASLPSLDPFLMKDAFQRAKISINESYFVISVEAWREIEAFMLLRFAVLVKAALPDAAESDDKARQLINTIWEARDLQALKPLIDAFRLPESEALDIFSSWKGIVYYSFQYQGEKFLLKELLQWVISCEGSMTGVAVAEANEMRLMIKTIRDQIKIEWQYIETVLRAYEDSFDKMFKLKTGSADFLNFLKNSNKTYWEIGNSIGKVNQAIYCWRVMCSSFNGTKLPWAQLQDVMRILVKIIEPDKKAVTAVSW